MQLDLYSSPPEANKPQPLSRFLTQRKVFITIDDATEYKRCRVQSNRKGVVLRDLVKGAAVNTKKQQLCRPGDFLVAEIDAKVGGYGFVPTALDGAIVSSHYYLFEVDESQLLPRYLYYLTQSDIIQRQISSQGSTNYAAIRPKEFLAIEIPYIEPDQQRELVTKLDALTQEAETLAQDFAHQATLLTHLRQAVLHEAVQGRLVPQQATDEPAPALLARIRVEKQRLVKEKKLRPGKPLPPLGETEVPYEVPEGWAWCRLGDLGFFFGGGTPAMGVKEYWGGEIPWVSPKDMKTEIVSDAEMHVTPLGIENSSTKLVPIGSILIVSRSGILKRKLPVAINATACTVNQDIKVITPYFQEMNSYVALLLAGFEKTILLDFVKYGTTVHSLKFQEFEQMFIPLPPLSEQRRIVAKVTELLDHCTALEAEWQRARQAADALHAAALREAFTTSLAQAD